MTHPEHSEPLHLRMDIICGTKEFIPPVYRVYQAPVYGWFGKKKSDWKFLYETTNPNPYLENSLWESDMGVICGVDIEGFKAWKDLQS
jgi:hypothetical protein